jgi:hypothetical protein
MNIYIDGLERSGNAFLSACIGVTLQTQVYPLFTHLVSALEERDRDALFVVPLRDALPSIVSAKIYRDYQWNNGIPRQDNILGREHERTGDPEELIQRYTEYTQYLLDHDDFFIAPFKEFTKDHNKVIEVMIKPFPELSIKQRLNKEEMLHACDEHYTSFNPEINDLTKPYLGNYPRESTKEKREVEELFVSKYSKEINKIQSNIDYLYKRYYREEEK